MPELRFHSSDGQEHRVDATVGSTIMQSAVDHGGIGIVGQCGGSLACASCHVYVDPAWRATVGEPGELEDEMLSGALSPRTDGSRLSCQIEVTEELHGLVIEVAPEQL